MLDINGLDALRGIAETADACRHRRAHDLDRHRCAIRLPPAFDALKQAAREVGSVQIQNIGDDRRQSLQRLARRRRRAAAAGARRRGRTALGDGQRACCRSATSSSATASTALQPDELRDRHPRAEERPRRARPPSSSSARGAISSSRSPWRRRASCSPATAPSRRPRSPSAPARPWRSGLPALEAALVGCHARPRRSTRPSAAADLADAVADRRRARHGRLPPRGGARDRRCAPLDAASAPLRRQAAAA